MPMTASPYPTDVPASLCFPLLLCCCIDSLGYITHRNSLYEPRSRLGQVWGFQSSILLSRLMSVNKEEKSLQQLLKKDTIYFFGVSCSCSRVTNLVFVLKIFFQIFRPTFFCKCKRRATVRPFSQLPFRHKKNTGSSTCLSMRIMRNQIGLFTMWLQQWVNALTNESQAERLSRCLETKCMKSINTNSPLHILTFVKVNIKIHVFPATCLLLGFYFCLLAAFDTDQLSNTFLNGGNEDQ